MHGKFVTEVACWLPFRSIKQCAESALFLRSCFSATISSREDGRRGTPWQVSGMSSHLGACVLFCLNTTQNDDPSGVFVDVTTIRSKVVSRSSPETLRCFLKVYVGETQELASSRPAALWSLQWMRFFLGQLSLWNVTSFLHSGQQTWLWRCATPYSPGMELIVQKSAQSQPPDSSSSWKQQSAACSSWAPALYPGVGLTAGLF